MDLSLVVAMSQVFQGAVCIPKNLQVEASRHKLIEEMWEHLQNENDGRVGKSLLQAF